METKNRELSLIERALRDLNGDQCVCGAWKRPQNCFCAPCYYALTLDLQRKLRRTMSEGFAEVYDEAVDWLRIETDRIKKL